MKKNPFQVRWWDANQRCRDPRTKDFHRWGGRGIRVEWASYADFKRDMYQSFLAHVRKHGTRQTQLDRKDNNGNYNKQNCRWATSKQQHRNRSNNHWITFNGKRRTIAECTELLGFSENTILERLRRGWSEKDATREIGFRPKARG